MSGEKKLSRRDFLKATGVAAAGAAASPVLHGERRFLQPFSVRQAVKVAYWAGAPTAEQQEILQREFIDSFNAAHAGEIELEMSFLERNVEVTQTALAAGEGPDVYDVHGPAWVSQFTSAGLTLPLDDFAEQYGWNEKLLSWALEVGKVAGSLRSLPQTYETQITDYNKTLFEEKGWTMPTNREEFETWADDALAQGVYPFAVSSNPWQGLNQHLFGVMVCNYVGGHKFWEALNGQVPFNAPEFMEAINLVDEYLNRGYFMGERDAYLSYGTDAAYATRYEGRGGLLFQGPWMFSTWLEEWAAAGYEWAWAPFPSFSDVVPYPQYNLGVGASTCVNAATENPDAAAEVLNWFYEDKARAVRIIEGFSFGDYLVPLQFTREDFSADAPELLVDYFLALNDALAKKTFGFTTWTFLPARTHAWIGERYDLVVANEMTTQEFMDGVQETYAEELAEGLAVPAPEPITPEEIGAM